MSEIIRSTDFSLFARESRGEIILEDNPEASSCPDRPLVAKHKAGLMEGEPFLPGSHTPRSGSARAKGVGEMGVVDGHLLAGQLARFQQTPKIENLNTIISNQSPKRTFLNPLFDFLTSEKTKAA